MRRNSYLTVTDQFCGAGGSSIGAQAAGLEIRLALNHWKLAIETHASNFPKVDHVCEDISAVDPRRYAPTDILITSPECTNHSLAKGAKRRALNQTHLFDSKSTDPSVERSRATMWDVVRFAELHKYRIVIVENVPDVRHWLLWDAWLAAMDVLGYRHKLVSLNSMHCHPTPQSRDRAYVVFWRKGNRAPDLDVRPHAPCPKCGEVEAVQTWKRNSKTGSPNDAGRYKRQYVFTCPTCRREVVPYYYAALNAIDWTLPAERIGDRARPLKERTRERIRYGLEKFGKMALLVTTNMTTDKGRARAVVEPGFTQTGSSINGLVSPFIVETLYTQDGERRVSDGAAALPTQTGKQSLGVAMPFLTSVNYFDPRTMPVTDALHTLTTQTKFGITMPFVSCAGSRDTAPSGGVEAIPTLTGSERLGVTFPPFLIKMRGDDPSHLRSGATRLDEDALATVVAAGNQQFVISDSPFLVKLRGTADDQMPSCPSGLDEAIGAITAGGIHHGIVQGAALLTMRDHPALQLAEVTDPLFTQTAQLQAAVLQRRPFLVQYYGTGTATPADEGIPAITGVDRHALVDPGEELSVDDCYFRMLQPHELQAGMAFPADYNVLGNQREKVKQIGNAVTPPAMAWLIQRCVESLHPEIAS